MIRKIINYKYLNKIFIDIINFSYKKKIYLYYKQEQEKLTHQKKYRKSTFQVKTSIDYIVFEAIYCADCT